MLWGSGLGSNVEGFGSRSHVEGFGLRGPDRRIRRMPRGFCVGGGEVHGPALALLPSLPLSSFFPMFRCRSLSVSLPFLSLTYSCSLPLSFSLSFSLSERGVNQGIDSCVERVWPLETIYLIFLSIYLSTHNMYLIFLSIYLSTHNMYLIFLSINLSRKEKCVL